MAILRLIDLKTLFHTWKYNKPDALAMMVTFFTSLLLNVELGLIAGVLLSIALYLWRTSIPHIAIVGRAGNTEHYRNVKYHDVRTCPHVIAVRVDESLYFANAHALEEEILNIVAEKEQVKHVVLICSAINFIDASALEALEMLVAQLNNADVTLHLAEIKEPVMERLEKTDFIKLLGEDRIFMSTHEAMVALQCV